ncbi:Alpha/beta hydrolase fold protein [Candidatus Sulfotelmatobacter kueseliae]|uniref:Alpha/beta hydrolase fold protein n=1 Tax=Candidatus Sulfotelmatobacter kueseliae TaxID=2042962 RepID=A0A2U3KIJ2_9BACT|nr:Alpha/beta hydrolase fold protein [Candidatus Sulfotelmatobacter kueseliae]
MTETPTTFVPKPSWPRRIARGLLVLLVVLAAAGFLYENISEARDRRFNPMPGRLIDVGGYRMHIDCAGQGSPTVVLDSGLGDSYVVWQKVQPQIANFTRVCSYDRAGIGYSEPSSRPRTSRVMAEELHTLLKAAGIAPPYVLVGHSMGGYTVRLFASLYPGEVAAMVLVDASHPDQENRFPPALKEWKKSELRTAEFLEFGMPVGIPRLLGLCDPDPVIRAAECNFQTASEEVAEMKSFAESAAETAATGSLGDMPLAVLSHDPDKPSAEFPADLAKPTNEAWEKMQDELAHLSTRGTRTIARNSSHYIQVDRPEVVVEAVRTVLEQARATPSAGSPKP